MNFDIYFSFKSKDGTVKPGIRPFRMSWTEIKSLCATEKHRARIANVRNATNKEEKAEAKKQVPAICAVGDCSKTRAVRYMTPTGIFMIDIDHCKDPMKAWDGFYKQAGLEWIKRNVLVAHVTVGGEGLRFFIRAQQGYNSLIDNMTAFADKFNLKQFGDFDPSVQDFSRLSFLPLAEDFLYENPDLELVGDKLWDDGYLVNNWEEPESGIKNEKNKMKNGNGLLFSDAEMLDNFTEEEIAEFEAYDYRGTLLRTIIEKWVEKRGKPGKGEVHNYYNEMIKYFRNICSNNKRCLFYLLPRFGHSAEECWSSIQSICKVNTLSELPKTFYFFMKDNGFLGDAATNTSLGQYMMSDEPETKDEPIPWLPPVFREFIRITPKDFRASMVNALLPVMGTLTSYLQAKYYIDIVPHTTSFFSVIYAPAGTGKSFVGRILNILFEQLMIRDYIQQARENIYQNTMKRKGANEKSPEDPHTMMRIIPPKNSETELLSQMKDNQGYHMFTYAAEMDSWAKGVKAAGGNKDDMVRVAWDNGKYGQSFATSTFKGEISLYWNLLITGTLQQLLSYFKNVENGLITRCSFTTIENQKFAEAPVWKEFNKKDMAVIKKFMERCDRNSYEEPCELLPDKQDVDTCPTEKFDNEIPWRFHYKRRKTVDMKWLKPTIDEFLENQRCKAALDINDARDVFRKRVAVRGFRLGIMCHALWDNPKESDLKKCIPFIQWWMEQDIESSLRLWGTRYNNEVQDGLQVSQKSIYNELGSAFTKEDVYVQCSRQGIHTPVRNIVSKWVTMGFAKKISKNEWEKTKPSKK